jgi:hypothetical protein
MIYEPIQVFEGDGVEIKFLEKIVFDICLDCSDNSVYSHLSLIDDRFQICHSDDSLNYLFEKNLEGNKQSVESGGRKLNIYIYKIGCYYGCSVISNSPILDDSGHFYKSIIRFDNIKR